MYSRYMPIYMLLILHPFPTPSFPRLPSPRYILLDLRQGVLSTIGDLDLSGTLVYRVFCCRGKGNRGLGPVGELGLGVQSGSWACRGFLSIGGFVIGEFYRGKGNRELGLSG